MLNLSSHQYQALALGVDTRYQARLAAELRRDLGAYLDDLDDPQLGRFVHAMVLEARRLGFSTEHEIAVFARPCVVYGAYAHLDPLFEPLFYAALPGQGARRLITSAGISAATAEVLRSEFARRSGRQLILDLAAHYLGPEHPQPGARSALEAHFPERAARLAPGALAAHAALAASEADRLGLTTPLARQVHADVAQLLGASFARDPLYPWAQQAYGVEGDDARRTARLRAALRHIARHRCPAPMP